MVRIANTQAAFDGIAKTLALGSVNFEAGVEDKGERYIWLPPAVADRLGAIRGPGESYADVILRLAGSGKPRQGQNPDRVMRR